MTATRKRDWFRILRDLMAAGVSMARIASLCGKSGGASTVAHWANGGEPKDSDARIVLALYRRHCPQQFEAHMREFEPAALVYVSTDAKARRAHEPDGFNFFTKEAA